MQPPPPPSSSMLDPSTQQSEIPSSQPFQIDSSTKSRSDGGVAVTASGRNGVMEKRPFAKQSVSSSTQSSTKSAKVLRFDCCLLLHNPREPKFSQKRPASAPPTKSLKKQAMEKSSLPSDSQVTSNWKLFNKLLTQDKITYKIRRSKG